MLCSAVLFLSLSFSGRRTRLPRTAPHVAFNSILLYDAITAELVVSFCERGGQKSERQHTHSNVIGDDCMQGNFSVSTARKNDGPFPSLNTINQCGCASTAGSASLPVGGITRTAMCMSRKLLGHLCCYYCVLDHMVTTTGSAPVT